jgi:hypothetical protein
VRVDAEHVVARLREHGDEAALVPAPNLEHPTWRWWKVI